MNKYEGLSPAQLRQELSQTLNALEYKLDVPARFAEWKDARVATFKRATKKNPAKVYGFLAAGAAGLVSILTGSILLATRRRR